MRAAAACLGRGRSPVMHSPRAEFSSHLYDAGFQNLVNIDLSSVVVAQQQERNRGRPGMTCACASAAATAVGEVADA